MRLPLAAALAATCFAAPAFAFTPCPVPSGMCGFTATAGSPVAVTDGQGHRYLAIANSSTSTPLICTRDPDRTTQIVSGGASTYQIPPGALQEFTNGGTGFIPFQVTRCAPLSGTASGMVEVGP